MGSAQPMGVLVPDALLYTPGGNMGQKRQSEVGLNSQAHSHLHPAIKDSWAWCRGWHGGVEGSGQGVCPKEVSLSLDCWNLRWLLASPEVCISGQK